MRLMTLGSMFVLGDGVPVIAGTQMRSYALAFVQNLDGRGVARTSTTSCTRL